MSLTWEEQSPNYVKNPKCSNTQVTIDKTVIRDDTGNYRVYQCHSKITTEPVLSGNTISFLNKTVGDCLNLYKRRLASIKTVYNKS